MSTQDSDAFTVTDSTFVAGLQCRKRLYFKTHEPGLGAMATKAQEALFEQSEEVRMLARYAFPGGVPIREGCLDREQAIRPHRLPAGDSQA